MEIALKMPVGVVFSWGGNVRIRKTTTFRSIFRDSHRTAQFRSSIFGTETTGHRRGNLDWIDTFLFCGRARRSRSAHIYGVNGMGFGPYYCSSERLQSCVGAATASRSAGPRHSLAFVLRVHLHRQRHHLDRTFLRVFNKRRGYGIALFSEELPNVRPHGTLAGIAPCSVSIGRHVQYYLPLNYRVAYKQEIAPRTRMRYHLLWYLLLS